MNLKRWLFMVLLLILSLMPAPALGWREERRGEAPPTPTYFPLSEDVLSPALAVNGTFTTLSAHVTTGPAPLLVSFSGELVGGSDRNPDFLCATGHFDFGDQITMTREPNCVAQSGYLQRRYLTRYIYSEPGTYQATFTLNGLRSEPVTIVVTDSGPVPPTPTPPPPAGSSSPSSLLMPIAGLSVGFLMGLVALRLFWAKREG